MARLSIRRGRAVASDRADEARSRVYFYEESVKAYGQSSRDCVFVDDLAENVEGARRAGLRGISYDRDTEKWIEELREEGVEL